MTDDEMTVDQALTASYAKLLLTVHGGRKIIEELVRVLYDGDPPDQMLIVAAAKTWLKETDLKEEGKNALGLLATRGLPDA
jgi:hypothetical protein